jgi:phosphatidate cytidylyltransferase
LESGTEGEWPFPAEAEVEIVDETDVVEIVEPVEAPVAQGQPPSGEVDVEAAAEHFASSVRAETGDEPGSGGRGTADGPSRGYPTEELATPAEGGTEEVAESVEVYETETVVGEPYDAAHPFAPESEVEASLLSDLDEGEADEPVAVGGEGPSWQEPTAVEVGGVDDTGRGGPDVPARFLTGVVLAAVALGSLAIGKGVFAVVASVLVLLAQGELYAAMQKRHLQPATIVGLATGALVLAAAWFHGEPAMLAMLALGTIATFLWYMTVPAPHRKHIVVSIGATILPVIYVSGLAGYALITLSIDALDGRALMIAVVALTVIYDTAAFAFGSIWGSRPLAQSISPKKSWEGAVAATLTLVVAAGILSSLVDPLDTLGRSMGLAIVVAIFAPLGDLAESLIKRDLDLKDMSSILPGHGGVLDRIDALLFVAPAAFLYFRIFL